MVNKNTAHISHIVVNKENQNKGCGESLIKAIPQIDIITADIKKHNFQSQRFFLKNGFEIIEKNEKHFQAIKK